MLLRLGAVRFHQGELFRLLCLLPPRIAAVMAAWGPSLVNDLGVLIVLNFAERLCVVPAKNLSTTSLEVYILTDNPGIGPVKSAQWRILAYDVSTYMRHA